MLIPAGVYLIASTLQVTRTLNLVIEGVGGATVLQWAGPSYDATTPPVPLLDMQSCYQAVLRNLQIFCPPDRSLAEGVRLSTRVTTGLISTRCAFYDCSLSGMETCVRIGSEVDPTGDNANNDFHSFINCSFANYGRDAVAITGSQVYQVMFLNCVMTGLVRWTEPLLNPDVDTKSPFGTIARGSASVVVRQPASNTRTRDQPFFTGKDVGKVIEIGRAPGGPVLRAQLASAGVQVPGGWSYNLGVPGAPWTPATAPADLDAPIAWGSQCAVRNLLGSFSFIGGCVANHLRADFALGVDPTGYAISQAGNVGATTIRDTICETSRQFLVTGGPAAEVLIKVLVDNVRVAADAVSAWEPDVISFKLGGQLLVSNSTIGDPDLARPLRIAYGGGASGRSQFAMLNSTLSSTYSTSQPYDAADRSEQLFPNAPPNEVWNCRYLGPHHGYSLMGQRSPPYPFWPSPSVSGEVKLDFTLSRTRQIMVAQDTRFIFEQLYDGLGTPMRLFVTHAGAVRALAFEFVTVMIKRVPGVPIPAPRVVRWPQGGAWDRTKSVAGGTDLFEFLCDGHDVFARVLGQAF